jgi:large conductance mechanosensitive channel
MLKEFKAFIMKGNLLDIAVAFIMALTFGAVVTSFTNDIVMQIVAAIFGQPDFSAITIDIGDASIRIGAFINTVINFVIIAFILFLVVKAYNRMTPPKEDAPGGPSEVELLTEIRDQLKVR